MIHAYLAPDKAAGELLMCLSVCLQMDVLRFWRTDWKPKSICFPLFVAGPFVPMKAERGTAIAAGKAAAGGGLWPRLTTTTVFPLLRSPGRVSWLYPCNFAAAFSSNRGEQGLGGGSVYLHVREGEIHRRCLIRIISRWLLTDPVRWRPRIPTLP